VRAEYARIATAHARAEENKQRLPLNDARTNALKLNWSGNYRPPVPKLLGTQKLADLPDRRLVDVIDWSPFFATWELNGKYPRSSTTRWSAKRRGACLPMPGDAAQIVAERWFRANAVIGCGRRTAKATTFSFSMMKRAANRLRRCIHFDNSCAPRRPRQRGVADFVAPRTADSPTISAPSR